MFIPLLGYKTFYEYDDASMRTRMYIQPSAGGTKPVRCELHLRQGEPAAFRQGCARFQDGELQLLRHRRDQEGHESERRHRAPHARHPQPIGHVAVQDKRHHRVELAGLHLRRQVECDKVDSERHRRRRDEQDLHIRIRQNLAVDQRQLRERDRCPTPTTNRATGSHRSAA